MSNTIKNTSLKISNLVEILVCSMAFCLLLLPSISVLLLIILVTLNIITYRKTILSNLFNSKVAIIFLLFYLFHLVGMLWSTNAAYGWKDLETKLSYLVFPVLFVSISFNKTVLKKIILFYVSGIIITCMYFLYHSYTDYMHSGSLDSFFYRGLSYYTHPTYISMYINLALLILFSLLFSENALKSRLIIFSSLLFLMCILMLLSSRMGIITSVLTCTGYIIFISKGYHLKYRISFAVSFLLLCAVLFYFSNSYYNRLSQVEEAVTTQPANGEMVKTAPVYNSATSRPELWKEALEQIKSNPIIGTGTGDIKDELYKQYERHQFYYAMERHLNPHNQFLHTTVALGLAGLLLLILCIILQLKYAFFSKDWLYFFFILSIALNSLTESILEVESGILLFNTFSMIFLASLNGRKINSITV